MKNSLRIFAVVGLITCLPLPNVQGDRKSNVQKIHGKRSMDEPNPAFTWTPASRLEWLQLYLPKISDSLKVKKRHSNNHNNGADELNPKKEFEIVRKETQVNQEGIIPSSQLNKKSEIWESIEFDSYHDDNLAFQNDGEGHNKNKKLRGSENANKAAIIAQLDEINGGNVEKHNSEVGEKHLVKRHAKKYFPFSDKKPVGKSEKQRVIKNVDLLDTLLENWYGSDEVSIELNEEPKQSKYGNNIKSKTEKILDLLYDINKNKPKKINKSSDEEKQIVKRSKGSSKIHYCDSIENSYEDSDVSESDIKIPRYNIRQENNRNKIQIQKLNNIRKNSIPKQMECDEDYFSESQSDEYNQRKLSKNEKSRDHMSSLQKVRNERHNHRPQYNIVNNRDPRYRKSNVQKIKIKRSMDEPNSACSWTPASRLEWLKLHLPNISNSLKVKKRHANNNAADQFNPKKEIGIVRKEGQEDQEGIIPWSQLKKKSEICESIEFDSYDDDDLGFKIDDEGHKKNKKLWWSENAKKASIMAQLDGINGGCEEKRISDAGQKYLEKQHAKKYFPYSDKKLKGKSEKHRIIQNVDLLDTFLESQYSSDESFIESKEEPQQSIYGNNKKSKTEKMLENHRNNIQTKKLNDIRKNCFQNQIKCDEDYSSESQSDEYQRIKYNRNKKRRDHMSSLQKFRNKRHNHRPQYNVAKNKDPRYLYRHDTLH